MNTLKKTTPLAASLAIYIAAIVAANVMTTHLGLVGVGFGFVVTAGTFAAGFALLARDFVQRYGGVPWVFAGITAGAVLSYVMADPFIATASVVAFVGAEFADLGVFTPLRPRWGFAGAALASNVISAPIDTILFLWIAGFPVTFNAVAGQLVAKLVYATCIPLLIWMVGRNALLRQPVNAEGA